MSKLQWMHMQIQQGSSAVGMRPGGVAHADKVTHPGPCPSCTISTPKQAKHTAAAAPAPAAAAAVRRAPIHMPHAHAQTRMCTYTHTRADWAKCPLGWCGNG